MALHKNGIEYCLKVNGNISQYKDFCTISEVEVKYFSLYYIENNALHTSKFFPPLCQNDLCLWTKEQGCCSVNSRLLQQT